MQTIQINKVAQYDCRYNEQRKSSRSVWPKELRSSVMKPAMNEQAESKANIFPRLSRSEGRDRRKHHRHDLETRGIMVERWDAHKSETLPLGRIVDISAGGVRFRTRQANMRPDQQV